MSKIKLMTEISDDRCVACGSEYLVPPGIACAACYVQAKSVAEWLGRLADGADVGVEISLPREFIVMRIGEMMRGGQVAAAAEHGREAPAELLAQVELASTALARQVFEMMWEHADRVVGDRYMTVAGGVAVKRGEVDISGILDRMMGRGDA